ncbi:hypothetical protein F8M41_022050 [Gigaspora margarita]|uniref:ATP synthase F0 subunit 8 n=1 Tax=Gigaspora margarita TaxID=4874 RepID=A0A8H4AFP6_GIGMA|nr:hypothetical protein F8M41_022050 [Gigaspora margarita]
MAVTQPLAGMVDYWWLLGSLLYFFSSSDTSRRNQVPGDLTKDQIPLWKQNKPPSNETPQPPSVFIS